MDITINNLQRAAFDCSDSIATVLIGHLSTPAMVLTRSGEPLIVNHRCELTLGFNLKQLQYLRKIRHFSISRTSQHGVSANFEIEIYEHTYKLRGRRYLCEGDTAELILLDGFISDIRADAEPMHLFENLIGHSRVFLDTIAACRRATSPGQPVLLRGESGTGKESLARCMHAEGAFAPGSIICLRDNFEFAEFTRVADEDMSSLLERLSSHTFYIDEIANFSHYSQDILFFILRNAVIGNYKLICATSADLLLLLRRGELHRNLYDTLTAETIAVPSLRQRRDDIPALAEHFMWRANRLTNRKFRVGAKLIERMMKYDWPGNMYELESLLLSAARASDEIEGELPAGLLDDLINRKTSGEPDYDFSIAHAEKDLIIMALNAFSSDPHPKAAAANALGIGIATLYRKMELYNISQSRMYEG